jgi:RNA polymerase-binding transcription factor DksA
MATAKKAPAKKTPTKKLPAKSASAKKAAPSAKKAAPSKKAASPAKKAAPSKKAAPVGRSAAPVNKAAAPVNKVAAPATKAAPPAKSAPVPAAAAKQATPLKKAVPAKKVVPTPAPIEIAAVKGVTKDGVAYTKDFDVKFLTAQKALLIDEKAALLGQATRLEDEANALIEEQEMGDVQFDDEGGEGDTMVVERSRDLTLSAQARQTIVEINEALARLETGRYGYSSQSGRPIPRERLEAIPWATMLVEEKVGGIGRR